MSQITAKVIADSITPTGERLTSLELQYPRWILAELNTHRTFSRSSVSSRAVPIRRMITQVWNDPAIPVKWGSNQAGMQAGEELEGWRLHAAKLSWHLEGKTACMFAAFNNWIGLHKEVANRGLEKRQLTRTIVSATDWHNFFVLRDHCFSEDTEVLTEYGWKNFKDVEVGEQVVSLDASTRRLVRAKVVRLVEWESEGSAISLEGHGVDLLLSHAHEQVVDVDGELVRIRAQDLLGTHPRLYKTSLVDNYDTTSKDYMRGALLGFYLGNGWTCFRKSSGNYTTTICKGGGKGNEIIQKYKTFAQKVHPTASLQEYIKEGVSHLSIGGKEAYSTYSPLGTSLTKEIPSDVWGWGISGLRGLFDGLMDADSNIHSQSGGLKYYTSSKKLADDVQRLALMVGFSASLAVDDRIGQVSEGISSVGTPFRIKTKHLGYRVSINQHRNNPKLKNPVKEVPYFGMFRCVELDSHHMLYVRRNGKAVWSGNCDAQPEIQVLAGAMKEAMEKSTPTLLDVGDFHLPYVRPEEIERYKGTDNEWLLPVLSTARCARVSYNRHSGTTPSVEEDKKLFERLVISEPPHASPAEHCAQYVPHLSSSRNFRGPWYQFRAILEHSGWGPYSSTGVTVEL